MFPLRKEDSREIQTLCVVCLDQPCLWQAVCVPTGGNPTRRHPSHSEVCLCLLTQLINADTRVSILSPPAEKRQDALPDCSHHQLPGSLHLHGGVAHRLLPFPLSKVGSFFFFGHCQGCWGRVGGPSERNPAGILDVTGHVSTLKIPRFQSASRSYWGKTVWSWDETFPISILQM